MELSPKLRHETRLKKILIGEFESCPRREESSRVNSRWRLSSGCKQATRAIMWGVCAMIAVVVLMDQMIWRPLIAWSEKFKFEQVEASQSPRSPILHLLRHSRILSYAGRAVVAPIREVLNLHFSRSNTSPSPVQPKRQWSHLLLRV